MMKTTCVIITFLIFLFSCSNPKDNSDAWGNFESIEVVVSAEASGRIMEFNVMEGGQLEKGNRVGYIDTSQLHLKKKQMLVMRNGAVSKKDNISAQRDVLIQQRMNLLKDSTRLSNLLSAGAATQKQFDDLNGQLRVIDKQLHTVETQKAPVDGEIKSIDAQIEQIEDQLLKSTLLNPVKGTVLTKYAEQNELTSFGRPLYKIANLDTMILRVYVGGEQLPGIKIGQEVTVVIDKDKKENATMKGRISWISPNAEFTPKIIQTKEERVNLVYAVKVIVANNGTLKIGMPGSIFLSSK